MRSRAGISARVLACAVALVSVVCSPAVAAWHATGYSPSGPIYVDTADVDWTNIYQGTTLVGRYKKTADPNHTLAWVEIWWPGGGFEVKKTSSAFAKDEGQVSLMIEGSFPPIRPQAWPQKCHATATWDFWLDEAENTGPDWEVDFDAHVGAAGIDTPYSVIVVDSDPNYNHKTGTFSADTPTWTNLPCSRWYTAAYVSSKSTVKAFSLIGGSLSASAATDNSWYAEYTNG